jgi:hypothetical protein
VRAEYIYESELQVYMRHVGHHCACMLACSQNGGGGLCVLLHMVVINFAQCVGPKPKNRYALRHTGLLPEVEGLKNCVQFAAELWHVTASVVAITIRTCHGLIVFCSTKNERFLAQPHFVRELYVC